MNGNCDVKICDFGLSRVIGLGGDEPNDVKTMYVVSRWYRAPELILEYNEASFPVDMWSVGCLFAEMLLPRSQRTPLFRGQSSLKQLDLIMHFVGGQELIDIKGSPRAAVYVHKMYQDVPKKNLREMFPTRWSDAALDLLDKMLQFNPDKRITVEEALQHPFLHKLYDGEEATCDKLYMWFDKASMGPHLKRLLYEAVVESPGNNNKQL